MLSSPVTETGPSVWAASLIKGMVLLRNLLAVIEHHPLCFYPGMGCEVGRVVRIQCTRHAYADIARYGFAAKKPGQRHRTGEAVGLPNSVFESHTQCKCGFPRQL